MSPQKMSRRSLGARTAATAVEMAVVSSVLFFVLMGSIELMRVTMIRHSADYGAYVGARVGIITGASALDVQQAVQQHFGKIGIQNAIVTVSPAVLTDETSQISVEVSIPTSTNAWVVPSQFIGSIQGRSTLLTERAALVMKESMPTPPPPPPNPNPNPNPNPKPKPKPKPNPKPTPPSPPKPPSPPPPPPPRI